MGIQHIQDLPDADDVVSALPLSAEEQGDVQQHTREIQDIIQKKCKKILVIVGPCSAWPNTAVIEYAKKLKEGSEGLSDRLKIVMRAYIQKPRTTVGWEGPMNQPDPFGEPDLTKGIYYSREMMRDLVRLGFPIADEALYLHNDKYITDLLSWQAIGARSSEDAEHRRFVSMLDQPVGLKHPTSGDVKKGVESVVAAQNPHLFSFHGKAYQTTGNPFAHLIMRGSKSKTNYDRASLLEAIGHMQKYKVQNPSILVDASHDNSIREDGQKDEKMQPLAMQSVLSDMEKDPVLNEHIIGFMAESFLVGGKQDTDSVKSADELVRGCSITDPCLGIEETIAMLKEVYARLEFRRLTMLA